MIVRALIVAAITLAVAPAGEAEQRRTLPPVELTAEERGLGLATVRAFRFVGNTAMTDAELNQLAAPYIGRAIAAEDLVTLCAAVTRRYVELGFVTSSAYLPDQIARRGEIEIQIVEGRLVNLEIVGESSRQRNLVRKRLESAAAAPLNAHKVEQALRELQEYGPVQRVRAELQPSTLPGTSTLRVELEEKPPVRLEFLASNHESAAIGDNAFGLSLEHRNLSGRGDQFFGRYRRSEGLDTWLGSYSIPISTRETTLSFFTEQSRSEIVTSPFDALDIEARSSRYGLSLRQPIYRKRAEELALALTAELRRGRTYLDGGRFSFSPGADQGVSKLSVLRLTQDWYRRSGIHVIAIRSTFSAGLDVLGASSPSSATAAGSDVPDGRFFTWLGQLQYARRFDERLRYGQLIVRGDIQLSADPLFGLEQFSLGGSRTVRGYPENRLVRDNGWSSSVEFRIPVLRRPSGQDLLQVAPFVDAGRAWNDEHTSGPRTLASVGVGLRYQPNDRFFAALYWGGRLRDVSIEPQGLQRRGFHFEASWRAF